MGRKFKQNQMRIKPDKQSKAKWTFKISPFFPGQTDDDDVKIQCRDLGVMCGVHGGVRFHDSVGYNEQFRLVPHGKEGWFYIWNRNERKYVWMDGNHDRGQA